MKTALPVAQPPEQWRYASVLEWGTRLGLVVLLLTFAAYVSGLASPVVPLDQLPQLWSQSAAAYLKQTHATPGWGWLAQLQRGDVLSLVGIVILSGISVVCLLTLLPLYWRRGDRIFVALVLAESAVVLVAASGWLTGGHGA